MKQGGLWQAATSAHQYRSSSQGTHDHPQWNGVAQENLAVQAADPAISVSITIGQVTEGDGQVVGQATVAVSQAPANELVIALSSSAPHRLSVPSTVTINAQATSASFTLDVQDNQLTDGDVDVVISANAPDFTSGTDSVTVKDND